MSEIISQVILTEPSDKILEFIKEEMSIVIDMIFIEWLKEYENMLIEDGVIE